MNEKKRIEYEKFLTDIKKMKGYKDFIYKQILEDIQHLYAIDYMEKNGTLKGSWLEDAPDIYE